MHFVSKALRSVISFKQVKIKYILITISNRKVMHTRDCTASVLVNLLISICPSHYQKLIAAHTVLLFKKKKGKFEGKLSNMELP